MYTLWCQYLKGMARARPTPILLKIIVMIFFFTSAGIGAWVIMVEWNTLKGGDYLLCCLLGSSSVCRGM